MKKLTHYICIILVFSLLMAIPVSAQSGIEPRESAFFAAHETHLSKETSTRLKIWFDVTANDTMQRLGVCKIEVDRSADGVNWVEMASYDSTFYPAMVVSNTAFHASYITYHGATPGYYYRAYVTFYAKNSIGVGELSRYTPVLQM